VTVCSSYKVTFVTNLLELLPDNDWHNISFFLVLPIIMEKEVPFFFLFATFSFFPLFLVLPIIMEKEGLCNKNGEIDKAVTNRY